jgi:hypothetical protein
MGPQIKMGWIGMRGTATLIDHMQAKSKKDDDKMVISRWELI